MVTCRMCADMVVFWAHCIYPNTLDTSAVDLPVNIVKYVSIEIGFNIISYQPKNGKIGLNPSAYIEILP